MCAIEGKKKDVPKSDYSPPRKFLSFACLSWDIQIHKDIRKAGEKRHNLEVITDRYARDTWFLEDMGAVG